MVQHTDPAQRSGAAEGTGSRAGRTRGRLIGVAAAVAAALAVWVVGEPLLGHDLVVEQPDREPLDLGAAAFAFIALGSGLAGWALLAVLERLTRHAWRIWLGVALALLLASYLPLTGVEASTGSIIVLGLAHLAVAGALIPLFHRTSRRSRP